MKSPRNAIGGMIRKGEIIRVKKGIYVKGEGAKFDPMVVANMIYGPSYVSLDYALSVYGVIPEQAHTITSVTSKRRKIFDTPVGRFTYSPMPKRCFAIEVAYRDLGAEGGCLVATHEKALADRIFGVKGIKDAEQLYLYLTENMRISKYSLEALSLVKMRSIAKIYKNKMVSLLLATLELYREVRCE